MRFYWTFDSLSLKNQFTWNGLDGDQSRDKGHNLVTRPELARILRKNRDFRGKNYVRPLEQGRAWLFRGFMNGPDRVVLYWVEP